MRSDLQRALADQPVTAESVTDRRRAHPDDRPVLRGSAARGGGGDGERSDERRRGLIWLAVVIGLLLVIGAAAFAILFLGKGDKPKKVSVPSIIGFTENAAISQIRNAGLVPVRGAVTNGPCDGNVTVQEQQVCKVDPSVDASVKDGSKVTYQLYEIKTVKVPSLLNSNATEASNQLAGLGLVPQTTPVDNPAPAGTVVAQSPDPYTVVKVGSPVKLSVSSGKVKLVDVTNQPFDKAKTR